MLSDWYWSKHMLNTLLSLSNRTCLISVRLLITESGKMDMGKRQKKVALALYIIKKISEEQNEARKHDGFLGEKEDVNECVDMEVPICKK